MLLAYMLLVIAVLGASVAAIVLRADPKRWDNRLFAAMAFVDAFTAGLRGVEILAGRGLTDLAVLRTCHISSIWIAYLTIEFAYSYPFNRRLPGQTRAAVLAGTTFTTVLCVLPHTAAMFTPYTTFFYFLPYFVATLVLLGRNLKRVQESSIGIRLVMASLAMRWASGMVAFGFGKLVTPDLFHSLV